MRPLARSTTVDAIADALRADILEGDPPSGAPLREEHLAAAYGVARHTLRAALRALAAEGLVRVEPHRGARVATLEAPDLQGLAELRIALETEAARLALERHDGHLPAEVHAAQARLAAACADAGFAAVAEAHEALHHALVRASGARRIIAAHRALGGELRLFLTQLRPAWDGDLAAEHARLLEDIEARGPEVLRGHITASTAILLTHGT
jgi:DNA-binding GntR family transcriptional regulator